MAENLAYDLSLFENRQRKVKPVPKELPRVLPRSRLRTAVLLMGRVTAGIMVGLVLSAGIYSRVMLTETVDQLSRAEATLAELQSEQTRLKMQLDSKASIKNIEQYATGTLGLNRAEKYQINYIALSGDDKIAAVDVKTSGKLLIPDINELFYAFVEHIN